MGRAMVVLLGVAACGAPQRKAVPPVVLANGPRAVAAAPATPVVALRLYEPSTLPGTGVEVTMLDLRPEEPRAENPQGRGFVEREPAKVVLRIRTGPLTRTVQWRPGDHDLDGRRWRLAVTGERVTLTRQ